MIVVCAEDIGLTVVGASNVAVYGRVVRVCDGCTVGGAPNVCDERTMVVGCGDFTCEIAVFEVNCTACTTEDTANEAAFEIYGVVSEALAESGLVITLGFVNPGAVRCGKCCNVGLGEAALNVTYEVRVYNAELFNESTARNSGEECGIEHTAVVVETRNNVSVTV